MLDNTIKTQLQAYLTKLQQPIELVASLGAGAKDEEVRGLLADIAGLSDKVSVHFDGTASRQPSFTVGRKGEDTARVQFVGVPLGHEFTSLVLALLQVGGHPSKAGQELIAQIKDLGGEYRFETYISLSCQNCPDVVQALNLMAVLNPGIRHSMIDGALFQDEVAARQIMSVPTVYLNGEVFGQGRMGLEEIVARLDTGAAAREAEKSPVKTRSTCWWSAAARLAPPPPSTPRARASAPAWWPSASAARCWIPWASRTSFR
ncbi:thioredoxin family protein [Vogesella fluminis]